MRHNPLKKGRHLSKRGWRAGAPMVVSGLLALVSSLAQARGVELHVGSVKTMSVGTITHMAVGNEAVVSTTVLENGDLVLIPRAPGYSDVEVWTEGERHHTIEVTVYDSPVGAKLETVRSVLASFGPGVSVSDSNGLILVSGSVPEADLIRLDTALQRIPGVISTVRPVVSAAIADIINFEVKILEVDKSYAKQMGIRWQDTMTGPAFGTVFNIVPNDNFGVYSETQTSGIQQTGDLLSAVGSDSYGLDAYLGWTAIWGSEIQLVQENGAARSLAEPNLSTVSGSSASFLAGGEIPIAVLNEFGQPIVEFKDYGIQLEISPVSDSQGNIRSKIRAEVSSIDYSTIVNGYPGILSRSTESVITVKNGETIAISGLVDVSDTNSINKVPFLGDIPILGELFKSRSFQQSRTELLMLVTPRIQKPNAPIRPDHAQHIEELEALLGGSSKIDDKLMD